MSQERPAHRLALIRSRAIALRIKYRAKVARQHACNCKTCRPVERSEPVSLEEILDVLAKPWVRDEPARPMPEIAPRRAISVRRKLAAMSRRRKDPPPPPSKDEEVARAWSVAFDGQPDLYSRLADLDKNPAGGVAAKPRRPEKCKACGLYRVWPEKKQTFLRNGVPMKVPHGILIPTCAACGVENIDAELAWRLDGELARAKQGAKTPPEYSGGCPVIDEAPQRIQSISALCAEAEIRKFQRRKRRADGLGRIIDELTVQKTELLRGSEQLAQEMIRSCAKALDAWLEEENER